MRLGRYRKFDFKTREHHDFRIFFPREGASHHGTCGTYAMSCLTGLEPEDVAELLPRRIDHWTEKRIRTELSNRGFELTPLTVRLMAGKNYRSNNTRLLSRYNVLLLGQHVTQKEGTWTVAWNYWGNHMGQVGLMNARDLIVNPIDYGFIVWHPSWASLQDPNVVSGRILLDGFILETEKALHAYKGAITQSFNLAASPNPIEQLRIKLRLLRELDEKKRNHSRQLRATGPLGEDLQ